MSALGILVRINALPMIKNITKFLLFRALIRFLKKQLQNVKHKKCLCHPAPADTMTQLTVSTSTGPASLAVVRLMLKGMVSFRRTTTQAVVRQMSKLVCPKGKMVCARVKLTSDFK